MSKFREKYESFLAEFSKGKTMVLSSFDDGKVSSRMMSLVCINGLFRRTEPSENTGSLRQTRRPHFASTISR